MKLGRVNKLKLFAATSMAIFTLFASFAGVYAWFMSATKESRSADNFNVKNERLHLKKMTVHNLVEGTPYIYDEQANIIGYNFNPESSATYIINTETKQSEGDGRTASMGTYSYLRRTNPLFLLFEFHEDIQMKDATIEANTENDFIGANITSSTGNPLSSVVEFHSLTFTSVSDSSFVILNSQLSNEKHFADITSDEYGVSQVDFHHSIKIFESESETTIKYVGVVLDYYIEAVEHVYSLNIDNPVLNHFDRTVDFTCDWVMEV